MKRNAINLDYSTRISPLVKYTESVSMLLYITMTKTRVLLAFLFNGYCIVRVKLHTLYSEFQSRVMRDIMEQNLKISHVDDLILSHVEVSFSPRTRRTLGELRQLD